MTKYRVDVISEHCCQLGEGPHWDERSQTLYYVDLLAGDVCQLDPNTKYSKVFHVGDVVSVVIPTDVTKNEFIIGEGRKLYKVNLNSNEKQLLAEVEQSLNGNRFNDGKCDASGRLWVGTMGPEVQPGVWPHDVGALYSYENGQISKKYGPVSLSNGLAWSLDNKVMYFIDSLARAVYAFDFDLESGSIDNRRVFFDFNKDKSFAENQLPDGMTIDKNGDLWVAVFNGSKVVKICGRTGQVTDAVNLPASCITSVCFGGPQLNQLFVTTASKPLSAERRAQEPKAGHLFRISSDSASFGGLNTSLDFTKL